MRYFLLVYNQRNGELIAPIEEFAADSGEAAIQRRLDLEREHAADSDIEVAVLGAQSVEQLKKTHRRYFMTAKQILTGAAGF